MLPRRDSCPPWRREDDQTVALRGSKSRNKVSVGEPAEGSLQVFLYASRMESHCDNPTFGPGCDHRRLVSGLASRPQHASRGNGPKALTLVGASASRPPVLAGSLGLPCHRGPALVWLSLETEAQGFVLPPYSVCIGLFFNFFQLLCVRAALLSWWRPR